MSRYYSPPNVIINLDNLDTWQHESTWVHFFDKRKGVIRGFLKGVQFYLILIIFFSECFYVFSQVCVSKYQILLQANNRIHINYQP